MKAGQGISARDKKAADSIDKVQQSLKNLLYSIAQRVERGSADGSPATNRRVRLIELAVGDFTYAVTRVPNRWKERLTPRERQVAALIAEGCSYKCVALRLGTKRATVATHLRHIYEKLQVDNRADLAGTISS